MGKKYFKIIILLAALLPVFTGCSKKQDKKNPYEYNIDEFKKIDESLILYEESGIIDMEFSNLIDIDISDDGKIFVLDDKKILIFESPLKLLSQIKLNSKANSIAVKSFDQIFVGMDDHIEIYDFMGNRKNVWDPISEKTIITSIAIHGEKLLIADYGNKHLWLFNIKGALLKIISGEDKGFILPSRHFDADFDSKGNIWAANSGRQKLEKYSVEGKLLSSWGSSSMELHGFSGCCNPVHFKIMSDGDFVTFEKGLFRIKIYDEYGKFKSVVASGDTFKEGTVVCAVSANQNGDIFVADSTGNKVRIFIKRK